MRISKVLMTLPLVYSLTVTAASSSPKVEAQTAPSVARTKSPSMKISVEGQKIFVESDNFTAEFSGALLTSVIDRGGQAQFCRGDDSVFPVELFFVNRDVVKEDRGNP